MSGGLAQKVDWSQRWAQWKYTLQGPLLKAGVQERCPHNDSLYWFQSLFNFSIHFIKIWFIYNIVLVSGLQKSDLLYIHTYVCLKTSILFQIIFPIGYYRVLSRVPCAIQ